MGSRLSLISSDLHPTFLSDCCPHAMMSSWSMRPTAGCMMQTRLQLHRGLSPAPLCSPFGGWALLPSLVDCLVTADPPAPLPDLYTPPPALPTTVYGQIPIIKPYSVTSWCLLPWLNLTDTRSKRIRSKCKVFCQRAFILSEPSAVKVVKGKCLEVDEGAKTFPTCFCGFSGIMRCLLHVKMTLLTR